jgi:hypothetical protein
MFYTVYKITNIKNKESYIGCHETKRLDDGYMGSGKLIREAIEKEGILNFKKEIIHFANNRNEMFKVEKEKITELKPTYNLHPGGKGGFGYINDNSFNLYGKNGQSGYGLENILKAGKIHYFNMRNDADYNKNHNKKIASGLLKYFKNHDGNFKDKNHSEETKKIIGLYSSVHQKGDGNSQYGTMWITDGVDSMKIKKTDTIPVGFKKGRIIKVRNKVSY